jgi:hypothetical protein
MLMRDPGSAFDFAQAREDPGLHVLEAGASAFASGFGGPP